MTQSNRRTSAPTVPSGSVMVFEETFEGPSLAEDRWLPHYLPQWTTPDRSLARYELREEGLRLRIDFDQLPWREDDGELRVSNLQTAAFSGPVGSERGASRHRDDLRVETAVQPWRSFTPKRGRVEVTMRAGLEERAMLAAWLVGTEEESPSQSGELCIVEILGHGATRDRATVNIGVKSRHDPDLHDDMVQTVVEIDVTQWHTYGVEWDHRHATFSIDGQTIHVVTQGIDYPLQLMVDLFELPATTSRRPESYPMVADVAAVRGYRPIEGHDSTGTLPTDMDRVSR